MDSAHKGLSGPEVVNGNQSVTDAAPESEGGDDLDGDVGPDLSKVEFPENPESDTESDSEKVDLPCGHESYDPAQAPEPPFSVTCDTCGQSWTVKNE
jgi:hypothetical protein